MSINKEYFIIMRVIYNLKFRTNSTVLADR